MHEPEIIVKVASSTGEIEELRTFWTRLNYHPESDIDFVQMLASVRPEILRPFVLVAYKKAEPVAMMIGRIESTLVTIRFGYLKLFRIPLTQLVFIREGLLGEWSENVAKAMMEEITKALRIVDADRALLCNLPINCSPHRFAKSHGFLLQRDYSRQAVDHWKVVLPRDFTIFLGKISRKSRQELQRTTRVLERQFPGKVRYVIFEGIEDVNALCRVAETVAQQTYQRGLGAGFIDNIENWGRLDLAARKGWLRSYVLFVEDKPIAFWSGERVRDVMYLTWTGFDPLYRKWEVGTILLLKMIEDLLARGIKEIDYGLGWAKYKERFGNLCLQEQDVAIYALTVKGCSVNLICTIENLINRAGKKLLDRLRLKEKVKRIWRDHLASKADPASTNTSNAH